MEEENRSLTPKVFMRNINTIYMVLFMSMMVFGSFTLFNTVAWDADFPPSEDVFLIIVPIIFFIGVVLGRILYKRKLDNLANVSLLKDKLQGLKTALIIKFALVEGPFLIGLVAAFSTSNIFYMMSSGTLVMYFLTLKPTKSKIIKDLDLNKELILQFNDDNQILN
ncbi:MAG TPA: hypothetical protein VFD77_07160 [Brumimicrobium sp.]|nr:hypothetical protein [Brumimicrobium sp.]